MKKRIFPTEAAWLAGILVLAVGTAIMEKADLGMSMVVAPAYLLHLKFSQTLPFFTFGMAEYTLQAVLLVVTMLVLRTFKLSFLFSFVTAVCYGFALDGAILLFSGISASSMVVRICLYLIGMVICSVGVSLFFHSYIPPEAYELFVKELAKKLGMDVHRFKTIYDCASCLIGVALSFTFFGMWHFEGVKLGTIFCALINGSLIGHCSRFLDSHWEFQDKFPFRSKFEETTPSI